MCMWLIPSHHRTCGAEDRCRYALLTCRGGRGYLFIASVRSRILRGCRLIVLSRCIACSGLYIPRATIVCVCFDVSVWGGSIAIHIWGCICSGFEWGWI
ncbi:hypothetical protein QTG54_012261 [Skeletonema marinoi]|uniref:Uncharacterized protein n=1 Tax=Skeletonema marinoi TaxID=267567 RepID=A0AAD8Y0Q7_9STRA|nr:hypothetical protein QTG54_012261 [Skeletonema marinoi]